MAAARSSQAGRARRSAGRMSEESYYIHGNTVRKTAPVEEPARRTQKQPEARPGRREDKSREERQQEVRNHARQSQTVRRNQEKALQMDLPYLMVLVIAACCTLYICITYLQLQSDMNARIDHIEELEQDLEELKSENDVQEMRINTSVDLDYVYRVATEELGMVYAGRDQVILYNKTESEYVRQNEDIPQY